MAHDVDVTAGLVEAVRRRTDDKRIEPGQHLHHLLGCQREKIVRHGIGARRGMGRHRTYPHPILAGPAARHPRR